ncbi:hypothetical protein [Lederbergia citrea]|uniref:hypothetical protein n=1 Tax=Lederbergia citrea TaxID=2833581 RepID=UPI001BC8CF83|nr:hypothetical protein [Lederbergia citrea]MBS4178110.1 hypothetical protein [Lederbergia citrea]
MNNQLDEITKLKHYFKTIDHEPKTKEYGLRLVEIVTLLWNENEFLKGKIVKADRDFEWLEKKADEWMLKAMEYSQTTE